VKYLQRFTLLFALVSIFSSGALSAENLIHVVGRGETIFSISRFYSVTADELMRTNGITDPSTLQAGRRLVIPSSSAAVLPAPVVSQPLVNYRVVRGDTLFSLARTHGITLQRLLEINGFSSNHVLRVGDVIKVPQAQTASQQAVPQQTAPVNNAGTANNTSGIYNMLWPVTPKEISYMTGQMGVVVEGERLETVKSLTRGNVVSAGPWRKFGRVVIVETTGGYYYMYGGLETLSVNVGDRITPGMEVGKLGINAVSEKPQLFFMVFRSDTPIDPALAPRASVANSGNNSRS
jgi:LysM repeat protein